MLWAVVGSCGAIVEDIRSSLRVSVLLWRAVVSVSGGPALAFIVSSPTIVACLVVCVLLIGGDLCVDSYYGPYNRHVTRKAVLRGTHEVVFSTTARDEVVSITLE